MAENNEDLRWAIILWRVLKLFITLLEQEYDVKHAVVKKKQPRAKER
jgi:hypothetical protein